MKFKLLDQLYIVRLLHLRRLQHISAPTLWNRWRGCLTFFLTNFNLLTNSVLIPRFLCFTLCLLFHNLAFKSLYWSCATVLEVGRWKEGPSMADKVVNEGKPLTWQLNGRHIVAVWALKSDLYSFKIRESNGITPRESHKILNSEHNIRVWIYIATIWLSIFIMLGLDFNCSCAF